jgi:hypothetical protein
LRRACREFFQLERLGTKALKRFSSLSLFGRFAMAGDIRMTVYLQPKIYRALKVKSATTDRSGSDLVNAAVIEALREDAVDLEAFEATGGLPAAELLPACG